MNLVYLRPNLVGGGEIYCRRLIHHLLRLRSVEVVLFCTAASAETFEPAEGLSVVQLSNRPYSQLRRLHAEHVGIRRAVKDHSVDVLHSPASTISIALPKRTPQVVTIHDLQHYWLPENFSQVTRAYRTVVNELSVRRAHHVIAISEFTRQDIIRRYSVDPDRVTTVLLGVDPPITLSSSDVAAVRARFNIGPGPFFIYPAALNPHKNHLMLIRAFARVVADEPEAQLVLTGTSKNGTGQLVSEARRYGIEDRVKHLGYVERSDLVVLMYASVALLFPSRFEGFGLPLLEAMQYRTPVIAAKGTSIDEVVGTAAHLLGPDDISAWANAALRVLRDQPWRDALVRQGTANLQRFSWDRCARETLAVYESALRRPLI